ncbi:MAG: CDP-diacylglycerol--glycerol-3-phosphate 3-phosphatidyltransferase [Clostridia bacterium]|nr:CDP-diacylglycerol--glycerol-3-phosphate 3-phosphatidyltransferase [Clostridia bacterium]
MTVPNILTLIRIALVPVFLLFAGRDRNIAAMIVFIAAAITDTADGIIARRYNQITDFGKLFDPLADKLLVMAAVLVFVARGEIPVWAATLLLGREFAVTSLRMIAATKGIVIAAGISGKLKTFTQCVSIALMLFFWDNHPVLFGKATLQWLCVFLMTLLSLVSCVDYFIRNGHVLKGSLSKKEN